MNATRFITMALGLTVALVWGDPVRADTPGAVVDPNYGGQILTLTEPQQEIPASTNPRYKKKEDGTVFDIQENLVWAQQDSYQRTKDWINWHDAQGYIKKLNDEKFGGASTWRLPDQKELASLFDENSSIPWVYYWTKNEVHLDPVFGRSHCCYWTHEPYREEMAWGFNFIRGKAYVSMKGGIQKSLTAVRPVRDMTPQEQGEAKALRADVPKPKATP